ncbi:hypothetical protein E1176_18320, partial [Fulvivirga sp. RKSG066]|uniref:methylmalonyl-CoA mutase family protein n=1 Tax=Fulvivirga aurantia TaxID=2529383 RepID=UPI001FEB8241
KATKDLKGTHPNEQFGWEIEPGIVVNPYYDQEDLNQDIKPYQNRLLKTDHPSGEARYWDNLQVIAAQDEKSANHLALDALQGGAEGIVFKDLSKQPDLGTLLKDIELPYCNVSFQLTEYGQAEIISSYAKDKPLQGFIFCREQTLYKETSTLFEQNETVKIIFSDSDSKGSFTDKIAAQLLNTVDLVQEGNLGAFFRSHALVYEVGANFFGEIASLRALRQLYYQVARAYGLENFKPEDLKICATSPAWINESYDPNGNMLKGTTAGMAAVLGGCDALIIEPEDASNSTMRRTARNISNILKEESYLNSAADPVAGSYYIESLTQSLGQEAWKKFQDKVN